MSATPLHSPSSALRANAAGLWSRSSRLRAALLAGSLVSVLVVGRLVSPVALAGIEPELVVLLRGVALIKAAMTLAAVALTLWRFRRPVSFRAAVGYMVGVWFLSAATALIWSLSFILVAALFFHLALFGLLLLAWREGHALLASGMPSDVGTRLVRSAALRGVAGWRSEASNGVDPGRFAAQSMRRCDVASAKSEPSRPHRADRVAVQDSAG